MAKLTRDQGLVLRTQDYAETDRIAVLLTLGHGRLDLLAKGAKRLERTAGAVLDVLNVVDVIFYRRSGLALLREVDLRRTFPHVRSDLVRLEAALSGMEWALRLVPRGMEDPEPYKLTLTFLAALEGGLSPGPLRAGYLLRLLSTTGHGPHLAGCVGCGAREGLTWSPERGGFLCRNCGGVGEALSPKLVRTLEALARLPLPALGRLRVDEDLLEQVNAMLASFRGVQLAR